MALHRNLTGEEAVHPFAIISATDPGAIGAGKAWLDTSTTPHTLKYRNADNDGWEDVQTDGTGGGPVDVTTQAGTSYTYALADANSLVRHSNAAAIVATIPPNSSVAFPIGTTISIVQAGAGAVTLTPGVGVTLKVPATHTLVTGGTDALVTLVQTAANVWTVAGNLVESAGASVAFTTLTDGATVTWATGGAAVNNAKVTLGGNRTLSITGAVSGATGVLIVTQDGTGSRTLALTGLKEGGGLTLSTAAGAVDVLAWVYNGTSFLWTLGKGFA